MKKIRKNKGFTLIELLLVLVILAVLGAVVVPKFANQTNNAKILGAETDISGFEMAIDRFEIDTGRYPSNSEGLKALIRPPSSVEETWKGKYIKDIPKDPWGSEYEYRVEDNPSRPEDYGYKLHSYGPDMTSGTEDDIKNWTEEE